MPQKTVLTGVASAVAPHAVPRERAWVPVRGKRQSSGLFVGGCTFSKNRIYTGKPEEDLTPKRTAEK